MSETQLCSKNLSRPCKAGAISVYPSWFKFTSFSKGKPSHCLFHFTDENKLQVLKSVLQYQDEITEKLGKWRGMGCLRDDKKKQFIEYSYSKNGHRFRKFWCYAKKRTRDEAMSLALEFQQQMISEIDQSVDIEKEFMRVLDEVRVLDTMWNSELKVGRYIEIES